MQQTGLERCGCHMIPFDLQMKQYNIDSYQWYEETYGYNNFPLSRRWNDENRERVLTTMRLIDKYYKPKKVHICHTSDSCGLLFSLRKYFDCEVTVLTNHPLFGRLHGYFNDTLGKINYQKVDCVFDNCFDYVSNDTDLVIFPEMEYFVPLRMIKPPLGQLPIVCSYYIDDLNPITEQQEIYTEQDALDLFSFKRLIDTEKERTAASEYCYSALGFLNSM